MRPLQVAGRFQWPISARIIISFPEPVVARGARLSFFTSEVGCVYARVFVLRGRCDGLLVLSGWKVFLLLVRNWERRGVGGKAGCGKLFLYLG